MLFYSLIIQLMVYNKTITRFIADDNVVYQWVRRDIRLASDNSWARHHLKHLIWRSRWIILRTLEQKIAVSCKISRADQCLLGLSSWLRKVLHCYAMNAVYCCVVTGHCTRLVDSLRQTVDASDISTIIRKFIERPSCTIPFWQIDILNQNLIFLWNFHDFV